MPRRSDFRGKRTTLAFPNIICDSNNATFRGELGNLKYMPGLARPGVMNDPEAYVGSRSDVKRICQKRGWGCAGSVNVEPVVLDEPNVMEKPYEVCDELVNDAIDQSEADRGEALPEKKRIDRFHELKESMSGTQP